MPNMSVRQCFVLTECGGLLSIFCGYLVFVKYFNVITFYLVDYFKIWM